MKVIKEANVAGAFYPGTKEELSQMLDTMLSQAKDISQTPLALVAPHAGYIYSGEVAATGYKTLEKIKHKIKNVVVFSPSHYWGFEGMAVTNATHFKTPLGEIEVNTEIVNALTGFPFVNVEPQAFEREHALEVHLPFLQKVLGTQWKLIPIIVGPTDPRDVESVIANLNSDETFVVVSSDLSHFNDYETCRELDSKTSALIEGQEFEKIGHYDACGYYPLRGLIKWAKDNGHRLKTIDLRNSGDTAGDKTRVVGYGTYLVC